MVILKRYIKLAALILALAAALTLCLCNTGLVAGRGTVLGATFI